MSRHGSSARPRWHGEGRARLPDSSASRAARRCHRERRRGSRSRPGSGPEHGPSSSAARRLSSKRVLGACGPAIAERVVARRSALFHPHAHATIRACPEVRHVAANRTHGYGALRVLPWRPRPRPGLTSNVASESVVDPHGERHFEVVLLALPGEQRSKPACAIAVGPDRALDPRRRAGHDCRLRATVARPLRAPARPQQSPRTVARVRRTRRWRARRVVRRPQRCGRPRRRCRPGSAPVGDGDQSHHATASR